MQSPIAISFASSTPGIVAAPQAAADSSATVESALSCGGVFTLFHLPDQKLGLGAQLPVHGCVEEPVFVLVQISAIEGDNANAGLAQVEVAKADCPRCLSNQTWDGGERERSEPGGLCDNCDGARLERCRNCNYDVCNSCLYPGNEARAVKVACPRCKTNAFWDRGHREQTRQSMQGHCDRCGAVRAERCVKCNYDLCSRCLYWGSDTSPSKSPGGSPLRSAEASSGAATRGRWLLQARSPERRLAEAALAAIVSQLRGLVGDCEVAVAVAAENARDRHGTPSPAAPRKAAVAAENASHPQARGKRGSLFWNAA